MLINPLVFIWISLSLRGCGQPPCPKVTYRTCQKHQRHNNSICFNTSAPLVWFAVMASNSQAPQMGFVTVWWILVKGFRFCPTHIHAYPPNTIVTDGYAVSTVAIQSHIFQSSPSAALQAQQQRGRAPAAAAECMVRQRH